MSTDRSKKIDNEVKKIHTEIKKSSLVLRERMRDIQAELTEFNILDGLDDSKSDGKGFLRNE
jgi:hypothetical protein